jgi:hypothetical protein
MFFLSWALIFSEYVVPATRRHCRFLRFAVGNCDCIRRRPVASATSASTGLAPYQLQLKARVERAKELMLNTHRSLRRYAIDGPRLVDIWIWCVRRRPGLSAVPSDIFELSANSS